MTDPRPWGANENGRMGNNMAYLRNDTADRAIIIHSRATRLRSAIERGEFNRLAALNELNRIIEESLRCTINMKEAGAPVAAEALDDHIPTILSAAISSK